MELIYFGDHGLTLAAPIVVLQQLVVYTRIQWCYI